MQKIKIVAALIFLATSLTIVPTAKANFTFLWPWAQITPPQMPNVTFVTPTPIKETIPTSTPTRIPTTAPKPTIKFIIVTPTHAVIPTLTTKSISTTPAQTQTISLTSQQQYIMNAINNYRKSQGLSPVQPDSYTCNFAKTRAQEITTDFSHNGFTNRVNSHSLPYSSYHEVTENIAMTSNYQDVETMWQNSPGHAANMRADTPYVCVAQDGNYFAYEGWKP